MDNCCVDDDDDCCCCCVVAVMTAPDECRADDDVTVVFGEPVAADAGFGCRDDAEHGAASVQVLWTV